jgi:hypothetical protein
MTGHVYIFEGTYSSWSQVANLNASDFATGDTYGTSVAVSGDYAIVGAPHNQVGVFSDVGAAYILFRDAVGNWSEQALLPGEDDESIQFGWSLAIDGDYAIVGAPNDGSTTYYQAGAAHVFQRSGTSWTHGARFTASERTANDRFGTAIARPILRRRVTVSALPSLSTVRPSSWARRTTTKGPATREPSTSSTCSR